MSEPREIFDVKGAVRYCGGLVSEWLFRREINAGKIPHFRIGRRILVDRCEMDRWIDEQTKQSVSPKEKDSFTKLRRAK